MATSIRSPRSGARVVAPEDRPWLPLQLFGTGFLFGALAAGVLSAINLRRLGRPESGIWSILGGIALSAGVAVVICFLPDRPEGVLRLVGLFMAGGIGLAFYYSQKPAFDEWYEENCPDLPRKEYRGNRLGTLIGVGVVCAAVQLGLTLLLYVAVHGGI